MPSSRSRLPTLAPRLPGNAAPAVDKPSVKEHTEEEWRSHKGLIESLYINDNRKLNETMAIMESKYGFAATEQMYKKRFKKWNIRKRAYRKSPVASSPTASTPSSSACDASDCKDDDADSTSSVSTSSVMVMKTKAAMARTSPPPCLAQLKVYAKLENVLGSILSWNQEKLESHRSFPDPMSKYLAKPNQPPIQDSRTMYRIFELLFDLWAHGRGDLAGMAARKGFYVLEFVLTEDHPDLIWHILDTVYDMVDRGHLQLLSMFLQHANVLARTQFPPNHPILRILQQLIGCDTSTEEGRQYVCHLLRQAWLRNVDLLSERIGSTSPQHLWLYEQLIWDGRTRLRRKSGLEKRKEVMYKALQDLGEESRTTPEPADPDEDGIIDIDLAVRREERSAAHQGVMGLGIQEEEGGSGRGDDGDEEDCTDLRIDALILEFTQMDIGDKARAEELAKELLHRTSGDSGSRANARFHAYARKMLARLHENKQDWDQVEENLKWAVRKREDAHGTGANLRVIRDMWVLSAYYERSGRVEMAAQTNHDALRRAKCYLEDLPG